jgi:hypothetical protein
MVIAAASAGAAGPFRDYGPNGAADAAAESAGAAVPFGDYEPTEATQRVTQDQLLLLRYRAVGPARWIQTYGDRGPSRPRARVLQSEVMTPTSAAGDRTRSAEVCYTAGLDNAGCTTPTTPTGEGGAARA